MHRTPGAAVSVERRPSNLLAAIASILALVACGHGESMRRSDRGHQNTMKDRHTSQEVPAAHLQQFPGVYIRVGNDIRPAPEPDQAVARGYPEWKDKGPFIDQRRITLLCAKGTFAQNEEIHVLHVVETLRPGDELYVMGPKQVLGEYVDGTLVTAPAPQGPDPLEPTGIYDGMVLPSPAADYNYEITVYRFSSPGVHEIQWKLGALESNVLRLTIQNPQSR
jgi:hypothetical protein